MAMKPRAMKKKPIAMKRGGKKMMRGGMAKKPTAMKRGGKATTKKKKMHPVEAENKFFPKGFLKARNKVARKKEKAKGKTGPSYRR